MDEATIALTVMTGSLFLIFLGLFLWGLKTGQFRNEEEAKFRMLQNIEAETKRHRKGGK
jgi:cbb3-type cytochrome oxidase maturation protein